jgi:hypothetical protein
MSLFLLMLSAHLQANSVSGLFCIVQTNRVSNVRRVLERCSSAYTDFVDKARKTKRLNPVTLEEDDLCGHFLEVMTYKTDKL